LTSKTPLVSGSLKRPLSSSQTSNKSAVRYFHQKEDSPNHIDPRPYFSFRLDDTVRADLNANKYKPVHQPGARSVVPLMLPEEIVKAAGLILKGKYSNVDNTYLIEVTV